MADQYDEPEPEPEPEPTPAKKTRKSTGKMSDKQKSDLKKHMAKMEKGGMSKTEMKSHRMSMMSRVRKGMTIQKAHNDVKKSS